LIIGAGLAGLTAARRLAVVGRSVLVVDKGRSVGGRLATRRIGRAVLDHGAQFFTVRTPIFQSEVDGWLEAGIVTPWCHGFDHDDGHPRYRALEGMNAIAKYVAEHVDLDSIDNPRRPRIMTRVEANAIIGGPDHWTVAYEAGAREPDDAGAIISTAPIPQSLALLRAGATPSTMADTLQSVRYHRVIAVLATLDRSPGLPSPGAIQQPTDPTFTFVADNEAKGISPEPAVTFHLSPSLSARLWDEEDAAVLAHLHEELRRYLSDAVVTTIQVKRWRYSGPVTPFPERYAVAATYPGTLLFAGDGFGDSKVEGAFLSGLAASERLLNPPATEAVA
jgi:predicted NAD/FAD-dependent oxidoreductase